MSSKATRSLNAVQAARASVTEKARRHGGTGASKPGASRQAPKAYARSAVNRSVPARNRSTTGGKKTKTTVEGSARSTHVVVSRIEPISVFKLSALFYLTLCLALFTAGVLLWTAAEASGLVGNIESFMDELGFTDFRLQTGQLLGASALASVVLVAAGSTANLLMALLYNLLGDVVGGVRVVLRQDREKPKG